MMLMTMVACCYRGSDDDEDRETVVGTEDVENDVTNNCKKR